MTLQRPSATIYRTVLEQTFATLASGLGLGEVGDGAEEVEDDGGQ